MGRFVWLVVRTGVRVGSLAVQELGPSYSYPVVDRVVGLYDDRSTIIQSRGRCWFLSKPHKLAYVGSIPAPATFLSLLAFLVVMYLISRTIFLSICPLPLVSPFGPTSQQ